MKEAILARKGMDFSWRNLVSSILPHILFILLVALVLGPGNGEETSRFSFLAVVIAIESVLIWRREASSVHDVVAIVFTVLILWEFFTAKMPNANSMLYPLPANVFNIFLSDWRKIGGGIGSSFYLLGSGFTAALILGIVFGMITGNVRRLRDALLPVAKVISPIPPIIYTPYAVAVLPSFEAASIFVIFSSIFWQVYISMVLSVSGIDRRLLDSARTLNLSRWDMLVHILFPYCLPRILKTLPLSVANAFMVLTAAEMIGASSGLGYYVRYYADFADYTRVVAGIILIGVVVSVLNLFISALERYIVHWR